MSRHDYVSAHLQTLCLESILTSLALPLSVFDVVADLCPYIGLINRISRYVPEAIPVRCKCLMPISLVLILIVICFLFGISVFAF